MTRLSVARKASARACAALGLLLVAPGVSLAEPSRPFGFAKPGDAKIDLSIEAPLANEMSLEPISISPDFYSPIGDSVTIAALHSRASQGLIGSGNAIRLSRDRTYDSVGFEVRYAGVKRAESTVKALVGLYSLQFDPNVTALKFGVMSTYRHKRFETTTALYIVTPLADSTEDEEFETQFYAPVWLHYHLTETLDISLTSGVTTDFDLQLGAGIGVDLPGPVDIGFNIGIPQVSESSNALAAQLYLSLAP